MAPNPEKIKVKPVGGDLRVVQRDEWKDVAFDNGFVSSYQLINNEILVIQGRGYSNLGDEKQAVAFGDAIISDHLAPGGKYIMIQDWKEYENSSASARRYFIDVHVNNSRLRAIVFCNTTWTQTMTIKIASRLKILNLPFIVRSSLNAAIACAGEIIAGKTVVPREKKWFWTGLFFRSSLKRYPGQSHIQDLLNYLETIDWQSGNTIKPFSIDPDHPMLPVFDAIVFIKSQLDRTFQERNRIERKLRIHRENLEKIITQRTRELQANRMYFKQLIELSPASTAVIGADYCLSFINQAFTNTFGWTLDEINETEQMASLLSWSASDRERSFKEWVDHLLASTGSQKHFGPHEREIRCKDGSLCVVEISANGIGNKILLLMNDITQRKKAEARLADLAIRDELTSLYNRRHFMHVLDVEFRRSMRYHLPLTMMIIDIDFFKQINDTHGHPGGDRVLTSLAEVFRNTFRDLDSLFRIGGEEFAILLPETAIDPGVTAAGRLKDAVEKKSFRVDENTLYITVSIGLSMVFVTTDSREAFMKRVDDALYLAKARGRNRIECL